MTANYVPTSRLRAALLELLVEGPRTTEELSIRFGQPGPTVRYYLRGLEKDCLVHHQKFLYTNGGGSYFAWYLGVRTANATPYPAPLTSKPARPPIVIRRDPLVAALFGPPAPLQQRNHP